MSLPHRRVPGPSSTARVSGPRRFARFVALLSAMAGVLVFVGTGTGHAEVAPVTNFASYPPALPVGCADGPSALRNVRFTANGVESSTLYGVVAAPGDLIVMSWDGFNAGCEGVGVGFSSKIASAPVFRVDADYWLYEFSYCGPDAGASPCGPAANQLTLRVPPSPDVPCYQLDAHLGPPLSRVGPTATYYGPLNGVRNLLISAKNDGGGTCALPPCPTDPSLPAMALLCEPETTTTTTAVPTTTTQPPPTSTSAPAVTTTVPVPTTVPAPTTTVPVSTTVPGPTSTSAPSSSTSAPVVCAPGQVLGAGGCSTAGPSLPVTGRDSRSLATTGALFLLSGLCLVFAYRRHDRLGTIAGD